MTDLTDDELRALMPEPLPEFGDSTLGGHWKRAEILAAQRAAIAADRERRSPSQSEVKRVATLLGWTPPGLADGERRADALHAAEARAAAAEADARRYRWLEEEQIRWLPAGYNGCKTARFDMVWDNPERDLGAAITAAMTGANDADR